MPNIETPEEFAEKLSDRQHTAPYIASLITARDAAIRAKSAELLRDALKARCAELEGGLVAAIKSIDEGGAHSVKRIRKMLIEVLDAIVGKKED